MPDRKNVRRDQRKSNPSGHYLKVRDQRILAALLRYRVLTVEQIYRIAFYDEKRQKYPNKSVVYARLRRLFDHAYIDRDFLPGNGSIQNRKTVYLLAERGALTLLDAGYEGVEWHAYQNRIGIEYIQHLMMTNEFMSRFEQGCWQDPDLELLDFSDERQLKADYDRFNIIVGYSRSGTPIVRAKALVFDAHIIYRQGQKTRHLFLESDHKSHTAGLWQKGKKSNTAFRDKILAVIQGGSRIQKRYGIRGFRMLTLTPSALRMRNLFEVAQQVDAGNIFWFATLDMDGADDLSSDAIFHDAVWFVCGQNEKGVLIGEPKR